MKFCTVVLDIMSCGKASSQHVYTLEHFNIWTVKQWHRKHFKLSSSWQFSNLIWSKWHLCCCHNPYVTFISILIVNVSRLLAWYKRCMLAKEVTCFPPDSRLWLFQTPEIKTATRRTWEPCLCFWLLGNANLWEVPVWGTKHGGGQVHLS